MRGNPPLCSFASFLIVSITPSFENTDVAVHSAKSEGRKANICGQPNPILLNSDSCC